ncbi:hypothetical protein OROGR_001655 [Orobanche gracilis]
MADRGYNYFYTPVEYDSYQQCPFEDYGQTPYYYPPEPRTPTLESIAYSEARKKESRLEDTMCKFMEMQLQQNQQQQQFQEETKQYQENNNAALNNLANQLGQLAQLMTTQQSMEVQTNTQTTLNESAKGVEHNEEESMSEGCDVVKIIEENQAPNQEELPQELPCTEGTNIDDEVVMMDAKDIEGLFSKEESCEPKKEMENKAEIDRATDEICALFNNKELGRIWTPQHLYLKFMEFLPNRRKKTDDVLSVSFWPP